MAAMSETLLGTAIELNHIGAGASLRQRTVAAAPENDNQSNSNFDAMFASEKNPNDFPEGGTDAYLVVFGSFTGLIAIFGLENGLGAIQSYISTNQLATLEESTISWVFSIHLFVLYSFGIIFGGVFDLMGAKIPLLISGVCTVLGLLITAQCKSLSQFIGAFSILTGIGTSLGMQALIAPISHWFLQKRAFACSVATIGGLVGSAAFASMLQRMYSSVGFVWAIRVLSLVIGICMIIAVAFVKGKNESNLKLFNLSEKPEEKTIAESQPRLEEGDVFGDNNEAEVPSELLNAHVSDNGTPVLKSPKWDLGSFTDFFSGLIDFRVCKDPKFISLTLAVALADLNLLSTITYLSSFALTFKVNSKIAYLLLTIVNISGIPSRLILGLLADRYGRFNVMIIYSSLVMVSIFALWLPAKGNKALLIAFSVCFGISSSALLSLIPACCGQICSSEKFGRVYGTMYFFVAFTTFIGIYLISLLLGDGSPMKYLNLVYVNGACSFVAIIIWVWARWCNVGWKWCKY